MEGEWRAPQDKVLSDELLALLSPLTPLERYTIADWRALLAGVARGQNPIRTSVKYVLHFLQLKSETLAVNTLTGYARSGSRRNSEPGPRKGILRLITPAWCLELVLAALTKAFSKPSGLAVSST